MSVRSSVRADFKKIFTYYWVFDVTVGKTFDVNWVRQSEADWVSYGRRGMWSG